MPDAPDSARAARGGGKVALGAVSALVLSGASALVLQVIWMRALARCFGSTTQATSTVLAAFMVGLAAGSAAGGRFADRLRRPARAYAAAEIGIALFAGVSLPVIDLVGRAAEAQAPDGAWSVAVTFGAALAALMPPTLLMGATFPLLAPLAGREGGPGLALLYGANTIGAAAGALASGFVLAPHLGFQRTVGVAACLNLLAACSAVALCDGPAGEAPGVAGPGPGDAAGDASAASAAAAANLAGTARIGLLAMLAASGAATMAYEVVMARVTALVFGSSVHSFALCLAAFLAGIGAGGLLARRAGRRAGPGGSKALAGPAALLSTAGALAAVLMAVGAGQLPRLSFEMHHRLAGAYRLLQAAELGALAALMLPPALAMGAAFPLALTALVRRDAHGAGAGTGIAVNTAGACIGAVAAGFWLLPVLGLERLLVSAAAMVAVAGAAAALASPWGFAGRAAAALAAATALLIAGTWPGWDRRQLATGLFIGFEDYESFDELRADLAASELVYDRDGAVASVAVFESDGGHRSLHVNGKADASTSRVDVQTQYLLGHLPALLHGSPRRALVVGLGSGATAHAVALHPTVARVDVAEIEPAVLPATGWFHDLNHDVLADPKVAIHAVDGRRLVRRAAPGSYDLVVSEPSNPWVAGVGDLFTREHFERVRRVLAPGGLFTQWVQGYCLDRRWLLAVLRTVSEVFPEVTVWYSNEGDFLVVASESPHVLDVDRVRDVLEGVPLIARELDDAGVGGARGLAARYLRGDREVRSLSAGAEILTEDRPQLEFFAPRDLHRDTEEENFAMLAGGASSCPLRASPRPAALEAAEWLELARTARRADRVAMALAAYREAACLDPDPRTLADWSRYLRRLDRPDLAGEVVAWGLRADARDLTLVVLAGELGIGTGAGEGAADTMPAPGTPPGTPPGSP